MEALNKNPLPSPHSPYTLVEAIEATHLSTPPNDHLSEEEYLQILSRYRGKYSLNAIDGYHETLQNYPNLHDWDVAPFKEKFFSKNSFYPSNILYYYTMLLCNRVSLDIDILHSPYSIPPIFNSQVAQHINETISTLGYTRKQSASYMVSFTKLVLITGKPLTSITLQDFYKFSLLAPKNSNKIIFYALKTWGNIDESEVFISYKTKNRIHSLDNLVTTNFLLLYTYDCFKKYTNKTEVSATAWKKNAIAQHFLNWLGDTYPDFSDFKLLKFNDIKTFFDTKKASLLLEEANISTSLINAQLSRFKHGFLKYLFSTKQLSDELSTQIFGINSSYATLYMVKTKGFSVPVPLEDRLLIEKAILTDYDNINEVYVDIIRLCYYLGLRPSEALCLKLNCITGLKQTPSLHIHKAKAFKERYVPLAKEPLELIKKWQKRNANSSSIYMNYDKQTSQRLFHYKGSVCAFNTIGNYFKDILARNSILKLDGSSKYSIYILRKIRISTWLEAGLSENEVAYLVGHSDVNSHNNYIISNELRTNNIQKVYNTFYKDLIDKLKSGETYVHTPSEHLTDDELYQLKQTLLEIESKTLNTVAKENILKEFSHATLPMPCGTCLANVYDETYTCGNMDLPCLDCESLVVTSDSANIFDNHVKRLYLQLVNSNTQQLDGLVLKISGQISRLKNFYISVLGYDIASVDTKFDTIKKETVQKKGRPKKGSLK